MFYKKCEICGRKSGRKSSQKRIFMAQFPLDEKRCKQWVKAVGNEDFVFTPIEKLHQLKYLCGTHFKPKDFNKKKTRLKRCAIPLLHLKREPLPEEALKDFPLHVATSQVKTPRRDDCEIANWPSTSTGQVTAKQDVGNSFTGSNIEKEHNYCINLKTSSQKQKDKTSSTAMSCRVEVVADCGDVAGLSRSLYISDREDPNWLNRCAVSLSPCGSLLSITHRRRLCLLTAQWISATETNTFIISWNGDLPADATAVLSLPIRSSALSSQNGADWICIAVGYASGEVGFYTNTGHLLLTERLDEGPVRAVSCHTGGYGSDPDDVHVLYQSSVCVLTGSSLFQTLRFAKAQLARVQAGVISEFSLEGKNILTRKWLFVDQDVVHDAAVVGLELKNTYDHLLAASTYGGYDTWYRSVPPHNTLVLGAGARPYIGFHYALEGGSSPPLQDVARAVASKIKSALPGWLGGASTKNSVSASESRPKEESLSLRSGVCDSARQADSCVLAPDRRLAALTDNLGRIALLHVQRATIIRLFKGYRDSQCAFVQVFEKDSNRGPTLNIVKDIRKATFLIIYNPKKGLIDIRLMQRGTRVAAFTATKNGKLVYNTHGLVGSDTNYSSKKLNLPAFPCVLIDPDGKIKKFVIPFHYALEGENSQRSKDLHLIKELKNILSQGECDKDDLEPEILNTAKAIKTPDLKRNFLELIVGKPLVPPDAVIYCVDLFHLELSSKDKLTSEETKLKHFCESLKYVATFYIQIHPEVDASIDNHRCSEVTITTKCEEPNEPECNANNENTVETNVSIEISEDFCLSEVDALILQRLLELAQENLKREALTPKVTFADLKISKFKEFVTAFDLDNTLEQLNLKPSLQNTRISALASYIYKSMFTKNFPTPELFEQIIKSNNINPKDLVKLLIIYWMEIPLNEVNLVIIEKSVKVLYHICQSCKEATSVVYNEVSPWWQDVRDVLVDMPCPLRTMIVAMVCRVVGQRIEHRTEITSVGDAWVSVTTENAKWSLLIGKLEDISLLSIVLQFKGSIKGKSLPKLNLTDLEINLKYIYNRGKGTVSELIAKWLCSKGVTPEAIRANEVLESQSLTTESCEHAKQHLKAEDESGYLMSDCDRVCVEENLLTFKWLNLLKKQFPYSASTDNLIANMCWEYAAAWQKNTVDLLKLKAVVSCLNNISDMHLCFGLCTLIWMTYIKELFEASCRLVNKVGKLPKERLCSQDIGLNDTNLIEFLKLTTQYLERFLYCTSKRHEFEKPILLFEKIWDENIPALVEVAQRTDNVNHNVLNLTYQFANVIYYQCNFNIKISKPLNVLFDCDLPFIFAGITSGKESASEINLHSEGKLKGQRMKFLGKVIVAALELISCEESSDEDMKYCSVESWLWMENVHSLAELWCIDSDFIRREQTVGLYKLGYDSLCEDAVGSVQRPELLLAPLVQICGKRLKRCLEASDRLTDVLAALPPELAIHLQTLESDSTISANVCLKTTASVMQNVMCRLGDDSGEGSGALQQQVRLAELMLYGCDILQEFKDAPGRPNKATRMAD